MAVVEITGKNYNTEVVQSDKPVLIDFWAQWCGPCRMISPIIDEIESENQDIKVGKINVDNEMVLAQRFEVMSIPTLILFKNGEPSGRLTGARSKAEIEELIKG